MHMGHVALRVTDLERSATHAVQALGLRETLRTEQEALLSANRKHHELQLIAADTAGLDHVGIEVESAEELDALRGRLEAAGSAILADDAWEEAGVGAALRFVGPGGIVYEVYDGMEREPLTIDEPLTSGVKKFGHLTFFSNEAAAVVAFWTDVLGFRLSDHADGFTWVRCDQDHHGLAILDFPGKGTLLHHHAWAVPDFSALGVYCDSLARHGLALVWGPVRHGPGFNLATYLPSPDGVITEVYTDLLQIADDRSYEPIDWSDEPRALNLWGPPPSPEVMAAGLPVLAPRAERVS
jgi:catechol-2,3-dioxygenase